MMVGRGVRIPLPYFHSHISSPPPIHHLLITSSPLGERFGEEEVGELIWGGYGRDDDSWRKYAEKKVVMIWWSWGGGSENMVRW
jgi:hypothetical protein